jgi:hypothetical protein
MRAVMFIFASFVVGATALATLSWALEPRSVGLARAPDPVAHPDAVIQVYGADVWGVRGRFAIHTWIVTKAAGADHYRRFQVIGWRQRRGLPVVSASTGNPDGHWFGSRPVLLLDRRGDEAAGLIDAVHRAVESYPFHDDYVMWPGPNSNSFIAWIGLEVPALGLDLPAKAVGKSWMIDNHSALSGTD